MRALAVLLATAVLTPAGVVAATPAAPARDPEFDAVWRDGKAELGGYRLTISRYGHPRTGQAVLIYVTEPFSASKHVKLDDPARAPRDVLDVLKLNLVRKFQTGIYDYATMVSVFARTSDFAPVKVAFSSQEWCGQVYEELDVRGARMSQHVASYFEGESAVASLAVPTGGVFEDELFIRLRGLRVPFLGAGETKRVPFLASPFWRRLAHRPCAWGNATIERLAAPVTVQVPAGSFVCDVFLVRPDDGRAGRFEVEHAYPHRIVRWAWEPPTGAGRGAALGGTDAGELTGSARRAYWQEHDPGDERELQSLGLAPQPR